MTIEDVLVLMEIKSKSGAFSCINPRDLGADYDLVPIPNDDDPYWFNPESIKTLENTLYFARKYGKLRDQ